VADTKLEPEGSGRGQVEVVRRNGKAHATIGGINGGDYPTKVNGQPVSDRPKRSLMRSCLNWFYEHVYLPEKQRWARERVKKVVDEQNQAYSKLMSEISKIKKAVEDTTHGPA
jgi:hypothetical protein